MKTTFELLCHGHNLSETEAYQLFQNIYQGNLNPSQISAIMTFYIARPITLNELNGFKKSLLDVCVPVNIDRDAIDVCGTGGDQKNTFNISTLSALVLAASGITVAKHGNYGSSSVSGSSDILNYLGYQFKNNSDDLNKEIDKHNICFMHAPLFHPAMKNVAPIRKELGVKTFFNMLGPMVNPSFPKKQLVGVFSLELARQYGYLYQQTDKDFLILHSLDGYDEVSLTGSLKYYFNGGEMMANPQDLGFSKLFQADIKGGDSVEESAKLFLAILEGKGTKEQNDVVIANAGMALYCADQQNGLINAFMKAKETLESGKALMSFKKLLN